MSRNVPSIPANALTPSYTSVASSNGFSAGDLVYYKDNNFGVIPANAVAQGTFNSTATVALGSTSTNNVYKLVDQTGTNRPCGNFGRQPVAAKLTNDNIAVVFAGFDYAQDVKVFYKIINQSGADVLARTAANGGNNVKNGAIGVAALTGGGFATVFMDTTGRMFHQIYDNAGTSVNALTFVGNVGVVAFDVKPTANGGFAIATNNPSDGNYYLFRISSTGTLLSTGSFSIPHGTNEPPILVEASNGLFFIFTKGAANNLTAYRFNSSGAYAGSTSLTSSMNSSAQWYADNMDFGYIVYSWFSTGGNLYVTSFNPVSLTNINTVTTNEGDQSLNAYVKQLSGNRTAVIAYDGNENARLTIIDNAFANVGSPVILKGFETWWNTDFGRTSNWTIVEGTTDLFTFGFLPSQTGWCSYALPYTRNSKTSPYASNPFVSTTAVVGTTTQNVNGYARSNSTPNAASFLAAATQTVSISTPQSSGTTFATTPASFIADNARFMNSTVLNDGRFVIAYVNSSGQVKANVYTSSLTLSTTISVGTGDPGCIVRCCVLENGKLLIGYSSSNTNVIINFYSSSLSLLTTRTYTVTTSFWGSSNSGFSICALSGDQFVFGYGDGSGYAVVWVYAASDPATGIYGHNPRYVSTATNIAVASNGPDSFLMTSWVTGSSASYAWGYSRTGSATSFAYRGERSLPSSNAANGHLNAVGAPIGTYAMFVQQSATNRLTRYNYSSTDTLQTSNFNNSSTYNVASVCVGNQGNFVLFWVLNGGGAGYNEYSPSFTGSTSATSAGSLTINDGQTTNAGPCAQIQNLFGNFYMIAYIDTSSTIKIGVINTVSSTSSVTLTAGVTASNVALTPSPANGYYLAGVSASDCPAGGTGVLQTNGAATLSSQYPAGTSSQAFDFTSPTLNAGVRGTIAGRNMIIEGS